MSLRLHICEPPRTLVAPWPSGDFREQLMHLDLPVETHKASSVKASAEPEGGASASRVHRSVSQTLGSPRTPAETPKQQQRNTSHVPNFGVHRSATPGVTRAVSPAVAPKEGGHVWFNSPLNSTVDITPYSKIYGIHPRNFNFDSNGSKELTPRGELCEIRQALTARLPSPTVPAPASFLYQSEPVPTPPPRVCAVPATSMPGPSPIVPSVSARIAPAAVPVPRLIMAPASPQATPLPPQAGAVLPPQGGSVLLPVRQMQMQMRHMSPVQSANPLPLHRPVSVQPVGLRRTSCGGAQSPRSLSARPAAPATLGMAASVPAGIGGLLLQQPQQRSPRLSQSPPCMVKRALAPDRRRSSVLGGA